MYHPHISISLRDSYCWQLDARVCAMCSKNIKVLNVQGCFWIFEQFSLLCDVQQRSVLVTGEMPRVSDVLCFYTQAHGELQAVCVRCVEGVCMYVCQNFPQLFLFSVNCEGFGCAHGGVWYVHSLLYSSAQHSRAQHGACTTSSMALYRDTCTT